MKLLAENVDRYFLDDPEHQGCGSGDSDGDGEEDGAGLGDGSGTGGGDGTGNGNLIGYKAMKP